MTLSDDGHVVDELGAIFAEEANFSTFDLLGETTHSFVAARSVAPSVFHLLSRRTISLTVRVNVPVLQRLAGQSCADVIIIFICFLGEFRWSFIAINDKLNDKLNDTCCGTLV